MNLWYTNSNPLYCYKHSLLGPIRSDANVNIGTILKPPTLSSPSQSFSVQPFTSKLNLNTFAPSARSKLRRHIYLWARHSRSLLVSCFMDSAGINNFSPCRGIQGGRLRGWRKHVINITITISTSDRAPKSLQSSTFGTSTGRPFFLGVLCLCSNSYGCLVCGCVYSRGLPRRESVSYCTVVKCNRERNDQSVCGFSSPINLAGGAVHDCVQDDFVRAHIGRILPLEPALLFKWTVAGTESTSLPNLARCWKKSFGLEIGRFGEFIEQQY